MWKNVARQPFSKWICFAVTLDLHPEGINKEQPHTLKQKIYTNVNLSYEPRVSGALLTYFQ